MLSFPCRQSFQEHLSDAISTTLMLPRLLWVLPEIPRPYAMTPLVTPGDPIKHCSHSRPRAQLFCNTFRTMFARRTVLRSGEAVFCVIIRMPSEVEYPCCQTCCECCSDRCSVERLPFPELYILAEHGEVVRMFPSRWVHSPIAGFQDTAARENTEHMIRIRRWKCNGILVGPIGCSCKYKDLSRTCIFDCCAEVRIVLRKTSRYADDIDTFLNRPANCLRKLAIFESNEI